MEGEHDHAYLQRDGGQQSGHDQEHGHQGVDGLRSGREHTHQGEDGRDQDTDQG